VIKIPHGLITIIVNEKYDPVCRVSQPFPMKPATQLIQSKYKEKCYEYKHKIMDGKDGMVDIKKLFPSPDIKQLKQEGKNGQGHKDQLGDGMKQVIY
jgi:hypothetical protein